MADARRQDSAIRALCRAPNRRRTALVTTVAAYPAITLLLWLLEPVVGGWPIPAKTAFLVPLMVICMVYVLVPLVDRLLPGGES